MKPNKKSNLFTILMFISTAMFSQVAGNLDLGFSTNSGKMSFIGASGTYLHDIDGGFSIGGNFGLRVITTTGIFGVSIPIMANARYYVGGDNYGFYPEALIGFIHYRHTTTGIIKIKYRATPLAFAFGAGYKTEQSIDISARYEGISTSIGTAGLIGLRIGYWF